MLAQSSTCASPVSPCTHGDHAASIILDQTRSGLLASNQRLTASKEGTTRSITTSCYEVACGRSVPTVPEHPA
jgi:hypothetical protein